MVFLIASWGLPPLITGIPAQSQAATKMVMDVTIEDGSLKGDQQAALRISVWLEQPDWETLCHCGATLFFLA